MDLIKPLFPIYLLICKQFLVSTTKVLFFIFQLLFSPEKLNKFYGTRSERNNKVVLIVHARTG